MSCSTYEVRALTSKQFTLSLSAQSYLLQTWNAHFQTSQGQSFKVQCQEQHVPRKCKVIGHSFVGGNSCRIFDVERFVV